MSQFLDQQVHVLSERLKTLLLQCRPVIHSWIANPVGEGKIILKLWYPHDVETYGDRPFTIDDHEAKLCRLTVDEINLLGKIAANMAEDDFDAEFEGFRDGKAEYSFAPKK
jgi:hypothetical protein